MPAASLVRMLSQVWVLPQSLLEPEPGPERVPVRDELVPENDLELPANLVGAVVQVPELARKHEQEPELGQIPELEPVRALVLDPTAGALRNVLGLQSPVPDCPPFSQRHSHPPRSHRHGIRNTGGLT
jgi:hypothetical protein